MIANIMCFYKGSFSYETLNNMPLDEVIYWNEMAYRINEEHQREIKKARC